MRVVSKVTSGVVLVGTLVTMNGCMSLEHLLDPDQKLEMYGGTSGSIAYMTDEESSIFGSIVRALDLPLTVIFDTLLLPISAPVELTRGD